MNQPSIKNNREQQINALLDGELNAEHTRQLRTAAEHDQALARAINEAVELRQIMAGMPFERAPRSLRRKLRQIPRQQLAHARPGFLKFRWAMVIASVLVALSITVNQMLPKHPSDAEIAQARQDLNLALSYLARVSRKTSDEIALNVGHGFSRPVTENTVRIISDQFRLNKG